METNEIEVGEVNVGNIFEDEWTWIIVFFTIISIKPKLVKLPFLDEGECFDYLFTILFFFSRMITDIDSLFIDFW